MRKLTALLIIIIIIIAVFSVTKSSAQTKTGENMPLYQQMILDKANYYETVAEAEKYFETRDKGKHTGYKQFKRWEWQSQFLVNSKGEFKTAKQIKQIIAKCDANKSVGGTWTEVGPLDFGDNAGAVTLGSGRLNTIAFHPTDADIIYVGAPNGGVWKTTDHGDNWTNLNFDDKPTMSISAIIVDPDNPDNIWVGTGDRDAGIGIAMGVYKSTDGGATWNTANNVPADPGAFDNLLINNMAYDAANNTLLAATKSGIYRSADGATSWTYVESGTIADIKFHPTNKDIAYATGLSEFYHSTDNGATWTAKGNGLTLTSRMFMAVTPDEPDYIYIVNTDVTVFRSTNKGIDFSIINTNAYNNGQAFYNLDIACDPNNADRVFVGVVGLVETTDASGFNIDHTWDIHPDIHALEIHNGKIYAGTDGGFEYADIGTTNMWKNESDGLGISQHYEMFQSAENPEYFSTGTQDNSSYFKRGTDWNMFISSGDGMDNFIDYDNQDYIYGTVQYGEPYRYKSGEGSFEIKGNFPGGNWVTPFIQDKADPNTIYIAGKDIWKNTNARNGVQWINITNGQEGNIKAKKIEQSSVNTEIMYLSKPGKFYRTDDLSSPSPTWIQLGTENFSDIEPDPFDENIIYACNSANGVFKSTDKGENWTDISDGLPGGISNIVRDPERDDESMYATSSYGVYYYNSIIAKWIEFDDGLPIIVSASDIVIYRGCGHDEAKVKISTFGRGIWESDLHSDPTHKPVAFFKADKLEPVICEGVTFCNNSANEPSSFLWSFNGPVTYLDATSATSEFPVVRFDAVQSYDVTLQVANATGTTSKTKTNYINALNPTIILPFVEDFEDRWLPTRCWAQVTVSGNGDDEWEQVTASSTPNHTTQRPGSDACAYIDEDTNGEDWLITPRMQLTPSGNVIQFYQKAGGTFSTSPTFKVMISEDADQTDRTKYVAIDTYDETDITNWAWKKIEIPATHDNKPVYIAFVSINDNSSYWAIDDIGVGNPMFTDVTATVGTIETINGPSEWGDYDSDGDLDFIASGEKDNGFDITKLYTNDGTGNFTEKTGHDITRTNAFSAQWGDFDNDGDLDYAVISNNNAENENCEIFQNDGTGVFTRVHSITDYIWGTLDWGDYDNDGDLDLLTCGRIGTSTETTYIVKNNGDGTFTNIASTTTGLEDVGYSALKFADFNNDGWLDIILTGQDAVNTRVAYIYENDKDGTFTQRFSFDGVRDGGIAIGDIDNDGDLDFYYAGVALSSVYYTGIYENTGSFNFTVCFDDNDGLDKMRYADAAFGDYDNDGYIDLIYTGYSNPNKYTKLWHNNGDKTFTNIDISDFLPNQVSGGSVNWGDYDKDGDLDLLITSENSSGEVTHILRNNVITANTKPSTPANLNTAITDNDVILSWNKSSDAQTAQDGLSYNVYIGTTTGNEDINQAMASTATGYREVVRIGNTHKLNTTERTGLPGGEYFWSVQSIDAAYEPSGFAAEQTFHIFHNEINPPEPQGILPSTNGTELTVTEWYNGDSRQWKYATTPGGPYSNNITGETGLTYTPNFAVSGVYYVVCYSVKGPLDYTSNEVVITVADRPEITNIDNSSSFNDIDKILIITGNNFTEVTEIRLGGSTGAVLPTFTIDNDNQITCTVQAGITPVVDAQITLSAGGLLSNDVIADNHTVVERDIIPVGGGTEPHPTIQAALDGLYISKEFDLFTTTKTIDIYNGTYTENITTNMDLSPSATNMLVIQAHSGETPIIDAAGGEIGLHIKTSYTKVDGLQIKDALIDNIFISGYNCEVSHVKTWNATRAGIVAEQTANIHNCLAYSNKYGIIVENGDNAIIKNNTLYGNGGEGGVPYLEATVPTGNFGTTTETFDFNFTQDETISKVEVFINDIAATNEDKIWMQLSQRNAASVDCGIQNPGTNSNAWGNVGFSNIILAQNATTQLKDAPSGGPVTGTYSPSVGDLSVFNGNSTIATNEWRLYIRSHGSGSGTVNDVVVRAYYGSSVDEGAGIYVKSGSVSTLQNNIIVAQSGSGAYYTLKTDAGTTISSSSYNTYYKNGNANVVNYLGTDYADFIAWSGNGTGDLEADPQFVNPGTDFHLKSGTVNGEYQAGTWPPFTETGGSWTGTGTGTSFALGGGNPADDYSNETEDNGDVINQGCYGNTPQATRANPFVPDPEITSISVSSSFNDIDKTLTINGNNFNGSNDVRIGGTSGTSLINVTVVNNNQITCTVQAGITPVTDAQIVVVRGAQNSADVVADNHSVVERDIIPVDDNGGIDIHTTIQSAFDGLFASKSTDAFATTKIIDIYNGTYAENTSTNATLNPNSGNLLVIQAHAGEFPQIDASGGNIGITVASDYTKVVGFKISGALENNIYVTGDNCEISHMKTWNAGLAGIKAEQTTNIHNCLSYDNAMYGIHIANSNTSIVENNTCYSNGTGSKANTITKTYTGNLAIPDDQCGLSYAEALINIPEDVTITNVRVLNMNITHTYDEDLKIYLIHPDATSVDLCIEEGGSGANFINTNFDDAASTSIEDGTVPFTGDFRPEGTLSTLDSKSSIGDWLLRVCDDAGGDEGNITSWTLEISYELSAGAGLFIESGTGTIVKNNIFSAKSGTEFYAMKSDVDIATTSGYNTYFANGNTNFVHHNTVDYSVLATWNGTTFGNNDLNGDPLFVDASTDDYHIKSTIGSYHAGVWPPFTATSSTIDASNSPALDTGDPTSNFSNEPAPHGGIINQGCYGNTVQASKTTSVVGTPGLWSGNTDTDWNTTTNWDDLAIPTAAVDVVIPDGRSNYPDIDETAACQNLNIQDGANNKVTISTGGALTVNGNFVIEGGSTDPVRGELEINDGSCTITGELQCPDGALFDVNGGTCSITGDACFNTGSEFDISNGTLLCTNFKNISNNIARGTFNFVGGDINVAKNCYFSGTKVTGIWSGTNITVGANYRHNNDDWTVTGGSLTMTGSSSNDKDLYSYSNGLDVEVWDLIFNGSETFRISANNKTERGLIVNNDLTITQGHVLAARSSSGKDGACSHIIVKGDVLIEAGACLDLIDEDNTAKIDIQFGGSFINNNTASNSTNGINNNHATAGQHPVTFNATTGNHTIQSGNSTNAGSYFHDVIFNDAGGDAQWNLASDMLINNDMTITDGILNVSPNMGLTVGNEITNSGDATNFIVKSDATGSGSLIHNNTNVPATVERFLSHTNGEDGQWHFLTSSISPTPVSLFNTNNFYQYNENADDWWTDLTTYNYNGASGWQVPTGNLATGNGYIYYYYQTTLNYTGNLNYDASGIDLTANYTVANNDVNYDGWNLLGNPYPCALDFDAVTKTNVNSTVYYYDDSGDNYRYYNHAGSQTDIPGVALNGGSQYIPSGQGFFVKTTAGGGTLTNLNTARTHNTQTFWKGDIPENHLKLNVSNGTNTDEMVVRFIDDATIEFDDNYDAFKRFSWNDNMPQIYSYTEHNNRLFAINSLNFTEGQQIIPLGFGTKSAGNYSINILEFNFEGRKVYLDDLLNNEVVLLNENSTYNYNFDGSGIIENRFQLRIGELSEITESSNVPEINIYPNPSNGTFTVEISKSQNFNISNIEITDITGKIIFHKTKEHVPLLINISNQSAGIYFIKIQTENQIFTEKLIIQ